MFEENKPEDQSGDKGENRESNSENSTLFVVGEREYDLNSAKTKIENADTHIKKIEEENADLRGKLEKAKSVEDVLEAMNKNRQPAQDQTNPVNTDDLTSLVERTLENTLRKSTAKQNLNEVESEMKKAFGDKAEEVYKSKAQQLGFSAKTMQEMASQSPQGFMALFKEQPSETPAAPTQGSNNIDGISGGPLKGTYAFYQQLKKDNPTQYYSGAVQAQMLKDANELGQDKFFS